MHTVYVLHGLRAMLWGGSAHCLSDDGKQMCGRQSVISPDANLSQDLDRPIVTSGEMRRQVILKSSLSNPMESISSMHTSMKESRWFRSRMPRGGPTHSSKERENKANVIVGLLFPCPWKSRDWSQHFLWERAVLPGRWRGQQYHRHSDWKWSRCDQGGGQLAWLGLGWLQEREFHSYSLPTCIWKFDMFIYSSHASSRQRGKKRQP
ncbi:hypothetical protein CGRA01v4_07721 [Colletotrichum graminicola]|nr:hypothetical protein CGRA01v4_07721 [Colletotrichum graminicola]